VKAVRQPDQCLHHDDEGGAKRLRQLPVDRILDELQPHRQQADDAFDARDSKARVSERRRQSVCGPSPQILRIRVVHEHPVSGQEDAAARLEHAKALAQIQARIGHVLQDLRRDDRVETAVWSGHRTVVVELHGRVWVPGQVSPDVSRLSREQVPVRKIGAAVVQDPRLAPEAQLGDPSPQLLRERPGVVPVAMGERRSVVVRGPIRVEPKDR
jgi:hypothetical protein